MSPTLSEMCLFYTQGGSPGYRENLRTTVETHCGRMEVSEVAERFCQILVGGCLLVPFVCSVLGSVFLVKMFNVATSC